MIKVSNLLNHNIELTETDKKCCVCWNNCGEFIFTKVVSSNFTNHNVLYNSEYFCKNCFDIIKNPLYQPQH